MSWADFHIRCRYILKGQRLLTLNSRAEHLLARIPETGRYVFLNPKTGAPYQLHDGLLYTSLETGSYQTKEVPKADETEKQ